MKLFIITCFTLLTFGVNAQTQARERYKVNVPSEGISLTADNLSLTNDGCSLSGTVIEGPMYKNLPLVDEHKVPGILTQMSNIGGTWVLQCTAGPGFCFIWYTK